MRTLCGDVPGKDYVAGRDLTTPGRDPVHSA